MCLNRKSFIPKCCISNVNLPDGSDETRLWWRLCWSIEWIKLDAWISWRVFCSRWRAWRSGSFWISDFGSKLLRWASAVLCFCLYRCTVMDLYCVDWCQLIRLVLWLKPAFVLRRPDYASAPKHGWTSLNHFQSKPSVQRRRKCICVKTIFFLELIK